MVGRTPSRLKNNGQVSVLRIADSRKISIKESSV